MPGLRSVAKLFALLHALVGVALLGAIPGLWVYHALARCCGWWAAPATISLAVTEGMALALGCIAITDRGWLD